MSGEQTGAWLDEIERLYRRWIAGPGDAAFAISAVPKLVAAVRAALDLADEWRHLGRGGGGVEGAVYREVAMKLAAALAAAPHGEGQGLHEWRCPSCGATTRARMADQPTPGQIERAARAIYDVDRDTYCSPPWEAAEELVQADYRRLAAAALSSLAGEEQHHG